MDCVLTQRRGLLAEALFAERSDRSFHAEERRFLSESFLLVGR